jgi:DNA polymerase III delta prime subunit
MFDLPIHASTKQQLKQVADRPAHAYLFVGPPYSYKQRAAEELVARLADTATLPSPNVHVLEPEESGKIKIRQIKDLLSWLARTAYNPQAYRGVVIASAHTMTADAQGALLKMLEEPADKVVFVLIADNTEGILATIQSRTQRVLFRPLAEEDGGISPRLKEILASDSGAGAAHEAAYELATSFVGGGLTERFLVAKQAHDKQLGAQVVSHIQQLLHAQLLDQPSSAQRAKHAIACEGYVRQNVNPRLCLENLALEFAQ